MKTGSPTFACWRPRSARDGALALLLLAAPAWGQTPQRHSPDAQTELKPAPPVDNCVNAAIGTDRYYGCINAALARTAELAHRPIDPGTLSATSPANAVGTFSFAATSERMGNTFGHSVHSQRPTRAAPFNPFANPR